MEPLWYFTGATTVCSGLGYLDGSGVKAFKAKAMDLANRNKEKAAKVSQYFRNKRDKHSK